MNEPKFKFTIPPQAEAMARAFLKEVGRTGAKAVAAGVKTLAKDVRKAVKDADRYFEGVEERAKKKSEDP